MLGQQQPVYVRDGLPVDGGHGRHEGAVQGVVEHRRADVGQDRVQEGLAQVLLLGGGHGGRWWGRLKHNRSPFSFNQHQKIEMSTVHSEKFYSGKVARHEMQMFLETVYSNVKGGSKAKKAMCSFGLGRVS